MTRFEDEYRRRLDAVEVDSEFAESVRRRAEDASMRARTDTRRGAAYDAEQVQGLFEASSGNAPRGIVRSVAAHAGKGRRSFAVLRYLAVGAAVAAVVAIAVVVGVPPMAGNPSGSGTPDGAQVQPASGFAFDLKAAVALSLIHI